MADQSHTILLNGEPIIAQEANAAMAITPGHLITFVKAGVAAGKLCVHATSGGDAAPWFARERLTPADPGTTLAIDTAYASGETVSWLQCRTGHLVYAFASAGAPLIVKGDALTSNGDGTLTKAGASDTVVADAAENINNTAGATATRMRVYAR